MTEYTKDIYTMNKENLQALIMLISIVTYTLHSNETSALFVDLCIKHDDISWYLVDEDYHIMLNLLKKAIDYRTLTCQVTIEAFGGGDLPVSFFTVRGNQPGCQDCWGGVQQTLHVLKHKLTFLPSVSFYVLHTQVYKVIYKLLKTMNRVTYPEPVHAWPPNPAVITNPTWPLVLPVDFRWVLLVIRSQWVHGNHFII